MMRPSRRSVAKPSRLLRRSAPEPSSLVVATALSLEARAVRRGLQGSQVLKSGMGVRKAAKLARTLGASRFDALAITGLCGGLRDELEPGDLVVASEVRSESGEALACPSADLLAGALRRRGLRVHVGPILTADHVVTGAERVRLGRDALAVDMESYELALGAGGRPVAVVRAVVDNGAHPLVSRDTVRTSLAALRSLREVGAALVDWADAAAERTVLLAGPRSFCAGVERAIQIVERALERYGAPVYVRKQIVHNAHVVADLESRGAVFVDELEDVPAGANVVFSAHGVAPAVRDTADSRGLSVIDATCPLVTKVHSEARRFAARGDTVFLIGHAGHEEVEGTLGEAPDRVVLVEDAAAAATVDAPSTGGMSYLMQTTLAVDEASEVADVLRSRFPQLQAPRSDDICYATSNRQQAVREVARDADLVLVVGSENSSNSQRLAEVARREGVPAYLVDDTSHIDPAWLHGVRTIGVTAGASAPPHLVDAVVGALSGLGPVTVTERSVAVETVKFNLPKEVS
jgi:4-hydroxy-3-methylbut-2-enyl diphosphate reductase